MSLAFPIPRQTRQAIVTATLGQTVFGPSQFALFNSADVDVWVQAAATGDWSLLDPTAYTIAPVAPATAFPALFTVTLHVGRASGDTVAILGARLGSRTTDVTRAGVLQSQALESELDRQVATEQELRRDLGRALLTAPGNAAQLLPQPETNKLLGWNADGTLGNIDVPPGSLIKATPADAVLGIDDARYMTPLQTAIAIIGFYGDKTGTADVTALLQAHLDHHSLARIPDGTYAISAALNLNFSTIDQTVMMSAGVIIRQYTPDTPVFKAIGKVGVRIIGNGALLYGAGVFHGNPGGSWTGNSGPMERGIYLESCTDFLVEDIRIQNFGNAGIAMWGGSGKIVNPKIEGTHLHGAPVLLQGNFQNGILLQHSPAVAGGAITRVAIIGADITGTAQGILIEENAGGSSPQDDNPEITIVSPNIHDIPGQHAVYNDGGGVTVTGMRLKNIALSGFKTQVGDSGKNAFDVTCIGLIAENIGGNMFEIAHIAPFAGSLNNLLLSGAGYHVGRGISVNGLVGQLSADIELDGCTLEPYYIFGDGPREIDIRIKAKNCDVDGGLITATNASNLRIWPTIRQANATNTGHFGLLVASASADVTLFDPIITDDNGKMVYALYSSTLGSTINVVGTAEMLGASSYAIRATGLINWATTQDNLGAVVGVVYPGSNLARASVGTGDIRVPHLYMTDANSTIDFGGTVIMKVLAGQWSMTGAAGGYLFDNNLSPVVNAVGSLGASGVRGWSALVLGNFALGGVTTIQATASASNFNILTPAANTTLLGTNSISTDGTFAANSDALIPSQKAAKAYADSLVVGLVDDRGNYSAAGNVFPSAGGSGNAGAILKGDLWFISVVGTLGGAAVGVGDQIRALVDAPGQTAGNWAISEANIGYVPENAANKDTDGTLAANSDTKYASQKASKTYADTKIAAALLTTRGDIMTRSATVPQRLALGAANTVLASDGTDALYRTLTALLDGAFGSTRGMALVRGAANWSALALGAANTVVASDGTDTLSRSLTALLDGAFGSTRGMALVRGATNWSALALGAANTVVASDGTDTLSRSLTALLDGAFGSTRGMALVRGAANWSALALGAANTVLRSDGTDAAWSSIGTVARAANTILAVTDYGKIVLATSTFTQTFTAAATLGDGWRCRYRNNGTGIITLDPNASETVNGLTTLKLYPGEDIELVCDGANFEALGLANRVLIETQTAASSATLDFNKTDSSRFNSYELEIDTLQAATNTADLLLRFSTDGGGTYLSSASYWHARSIADSASAIIAAGVAGTDTSGMLVNSVSSGGGAGPSGILKLTAGAAGIVRSDLGYLHSGGAMRKVNGQVLYFTAGVNALRLFYSSGNISSGTVRFYGVR